MIIYGKKYGKPNYLFWFIQFLNFSVCDNFFFHLDNCANKGTPASVCRITRTDVIVLGRCLYVWSIELTEYKYGLPQGILPIRNSTVSMWLQIEWNPLFSIIRRLLYTFLNISRMYLFLNFVYFQKKRNLKIFLQKQISSHFAISAQKSAMYVSTLDFNYAFVRNTRRRCRSFQAFLMSHDCAQYTAT